MNENDLSTKFTLTNYLMQFFSTENVTSRGERLELLVNKTENLRDTSVSFRKTSRNLARAMFWNHIKMYVIVGLVVLFIIYVIVSMACGGLLWQECVHKK